MTIRDSSFLQCAEQILKYFSDCKTKGKEPSKGWIDKFIYDLMTRRDSIEILRSIYFAYYQAKELDYEGRIKSLRFLVPARHEMGFDWFGVGYQVQTVRSKGLFGIFKIMHKLYFTFLPQSKKPEDVYQEIILFINTLPLMHKELYGLNSEANDNIQFKIPNGLWGLLKHPDTLVIHYRDGSLSTQIRQTVEAVFESKGLKLERTVRYESGFDFENSRNGVNKSHSELVSEIIAKQIMEHKDNIAQYSQRDLGHWLKSSVIEVGKWSIQQIHDALYR